MFIPMFNRVVRDFSHLIDEKGEKEEKERMPPKRCKGCSDLPYCDLDYCLRWWH
jgi:hypothetical protein